MPSRSAISSKVSPGSAVHFAAVQHEGDGGSFGLLAHIGRGDAHAVAFKLNSFGKYLMTVVDRIRAPPAPGRKSMRRA